MGDIQDSLDIKTMGDRHEMDEGPSTSGLSGNNSLFQWSKSIRIPPKRKSLRLNIQEPLKKLKKSAIINRPIDEVIDDIFDLDDQYLFRDLTREPACKYCLKPGEDLQKCAGHCNCWLHPICIQNITAKGMTTTMPTTDGYNTVTLIENRSLSLNEIEEEDQTIIPLPQVNTHCDECCSDEAQKCVVCERNDHELEMIVQCSSSKCGKRFHPKCLKYWPQSKLTRSSKGDTYFRCPSHVCHTCVSDNPKRPFLHISHTQLVKCIKCPATYHKNSTCIPAGSQVLTASCIICPRHNQNKSQRIVNVSWCFICASGGTLICCETCPMAVHPNCLNISVASEIKYICEDCETGRMPLYGEMVWAKFFKYRWWPAIILPPVQVPENIQRMAHNPFEFVVRFFGTNDHGWISTRRVFPYQEGDISYKCSNNNSIDQYYTKSVEEAKRVMEIVKKKKILKRSFSDKSKLVTPVPYIKIKTNQIVPPVKLQIDSDKMSKCDCEKSKNACGPNSTCLNRATFIECNPNLCPAGDQCQNQMFETRNYPKLDVVFVDELGFGLMCLESIKSGNFIIEYVGEIINYSEFKRRVEEKNKECDENFYFLTLEKNLIIDAGLKGNLMRFVNHSCEPNCETQKWCVNGLTRIGLFATENIEAYTELTINYNWSELLGNVKINCLCGASKCTGEIGGKIKISTENSDMSKTSKQKRGSRKLQLKKEKKKNFAMIGNST